VTLFSTVQLVTEVSEDKEVSDDKDVVGELEVGESHELVDIELEDIIIEDQDLDDSCGTESRRASASQKARAVITSVPHALWSLARMCVRRGRRSGGSNSV
jgi:hypothetical protein